MSNVFFIIVCNRGILNILICKWGSWRIVMLKKLWNNVGWVNDENGD